MNKSVLVVSVAGLLLVLLIVYTAITNNRTEETYTYATYSQSSNYSCNLSNPCDRKYPISPPAPDSTWSTCPCSNCIARLKYELQ